MASGERLVETRGNRYSERPRPTTSFPRKTSLTRQKKREISQSLVKVEQAEKPQAEQHATIQ
jgi:hypothetical protein